MYIQNASLFENLIMGSQYDPDRQGMGALEEICAGVGLSDLIQKLPDGLMTQMGENGKLLSSGQKTENRNGSGFAR